jgi:superfamily II DNA or RNA helicase
MVATCIKTIKNLVLDKELSSIKSSLQQVDIQTKGLIFEQFLEFLYAGNGWLVSLVGGRSDAGADLLLYHPSTPTKVSFIIQAKNHKTPLTFDDTKIELIKFEEQAKTKYQCNNYKLISINGFVENAKKLENFGMGLYSWSEIEKLILNYKETPALPSLELVAHNKLTHIKINQLFKSSNKVAVIQATGTGKSYLIGQSLIDNISKQCLVLAPSIYILQQQARLLPWLDNVIYMTYAKAANFTLMQWQRLNAQFIVMDEFHRAGADTWGKGVELLIKSQPKAKYLGTTATHIRFLDSARNMADELFDNVIANELSLQDAIAKEILPSPFYISALYQLKETITDYKQQISACKATIADKEKSNNELDTLFVDWEASSGVPDIFNKHLKNINGKFIIFCENVEHLDDMSEQVRSWFRDAAKIRGENIRRYDYVVHSQLSDGEIKNDLSEFENADNTKGIHLLFSVNMLNEGLHIKGVSGVVLLRKTTSPIVYFQQIGRCLQVDGGEQPVIFDLVNNINNIQTNTLEKSLNGAIESEQEKRLGLGLPKHQVELHIIDETVSINKALQFIEQRLSLQLNSFDFGYNELIIYKKTFGDCNVETGYISSIGFNLANWVFGQRKKYKRELLKKEHVEKLNLQGFIWNTLEESWERGIEELKLYLNKNQSSIILQKYTSNSGFSLGSWISDQRKKYAKKIIPKYQEIQLSALNIIWNENEHQWFEMYELLKDYKKEYDVFIIKGTYKTKEGINLGQWASDQKKAYNKGTISADKLKLLNDLDFIWSADQYYWDQGLLELINYQKQHNTCLVWQYYETDKGFKLGSWVSERRKAFSKGRLTKDKINQLNELGFAWNKYEFEWNQGFQLLLEYKNLHGHCYVPSKSDNPNMKKLCIWVNTQMKSKTSGSLPENNFTKLDAVGFIWDRTEYQWQQAVVSLKRYIEDNNEMPKKTYKDELGFGLGIWVGNRRRDLKNNKLNTKQKEELLNLGFI